MAVYMLSSGVVSILLCRYDVTNMLTWPSAAQETLFNEDGTEKDEAAGVIAVEAKEASKP